MALDVAHGMELSRKQQNNVYSILRRNLLESLILVGEHSTNILEYSGTQIPPPQPPHPCYAHFLKKIP